MPNSIPYRFYIGRRNLFTFYKVLLSEIYCVLHIIEYLIFRSDLDCLAEGNDHYQERFTVAVNVFVSDTERHPSQPAPWIKDQTKCTCDVLFSSQIEQDEIVDNFGKYVARDFTKMKL